MSTSVHKPAANQFASYAFQENEENEDDQEDDEKEGDMDEWSDEEDLYSDDDDEFEDDFEDDDDDEEDDEFDDDFDSETEEDDHEYVYDEDSHYRNNNNASAGPGYFYPEQPYIGPPIVPKPSPEASSSKLRYYVLSPICDIAMIYMKFAILAILIYACALWYTIYYGDLSLDDNDADADTCPAN